MELEPSVRGPLHLVDPGVVRVGVIEVRHVLLARVSGSHHHGIEHADVEPLPAGAGHLRRGEDGCVEADPAAVEELHRRQLPPRELEAHRLEELEPLGEERPLLREEQLLVAQIEHHLVRLHLPEVRVDGRVEREVRGEPHPEIRAHVARRLHQPRLGKDRIGVLRPELEPGRGVRGELEGPVGNEIIQAGERAEVRDQPVDAPRDQGGVEDLVRAVNGAPHQEPPLLGGGAREPQEVERDRKLGAPSIRERGHGGVPDRVPGVGEVDVAVEETVAERPRGVHAEVVAGPPVVGGVDADLHLVADERRVAPAELALDELRLRVVADHQDVEGPVVMEHADLGAKLRRRNAALVGELLEELAEGRGQLPHRVVRAPIQLRRLGGARGADRSLRGGRWHRGRRGEQEEVGERHSGNRTGSPE